MSKDDEGNDDVLSQVRQALEQLDVGSPESRDALVDGVRDALGKMKDNFGDVLQPQQGRPDLRVISDDDDEEEEDTVPASPSSKPDPHVTVRWVGSEQEYRERTLDGVGRIVVPGEPEDPTEAWQTVFKGTAPRAYRLEVTEGVLEIVADDEPVARLHPNQTTDVEASTISVRGIGGPATGRYVIL